jgi:hypothetical protein
MITVFPTKNKMVIVKTLISSYIQAKVKVRNDEEVSRLESIVEPKKAKSES